MDIAAHVEAESRKIREADLERAKAALQAANACGNFDNVTYRIARVECDTPPPLMMVFDVKSSAIDGPRLPEPPAVPDEVYVPPEERGARAPVAANPPVHGGRVVATEPNPPLPTRTEEVGEHLFPEDPHALALCLHCGCTLEAAELRPRCGA